MKEENIAIRLKFLIEKLRLTDSQFADKCNISRSTLSLFLSGKNKKLSDVMITQIHDIYPDLSINWLLFGEGDMWKDEGQKLIVSEFDQNSPENDEKENSNDSPSSRIDDFIIPENSIFMDKDTENFERSKENALESGQNSKKNIDYKSVNPNIKNEKESNEKKSTNKIRKVIQVTIYYNDSTFENLYPS